LVNCGKKRKRNGRNDEEPGKVCKEKKLEVNVERTKMMKKEKEEEWREWVELGRKENRTSKLVSFNTFEESK
jgi:hypothetical protein